MRFFVEFQSFGGVLGGKTWSEEQFGPLKSLSVGPRAPGTDFGGFGGQFGRHFGCIFRVFSSQNRGRNFGPEKIKDK
jgi:hypothetical protein